MARSPIVCGIDGSPASSEAAQLARTIARRVGARLDLVVLLRRFGESERLQQAQSLRAELGEDMGPGVMLRTTTGSAMEQLVVASRGAALVVVSAGRDGGASRALTARVSSAVARFAAAPVLVIPPGAAVRALAGARGAIVCGVRDPEDLPSAATAACWARDLGIGLTLAHVVPPPRLPIAPAGGAPPPGLVVGSAERCAEASWMLGEMARAVAPTAGRCRTVVVAGPVGPELDRLAATEDAAMVALGPRGQRPLAGVLSASVSKHLLRRGRRPVLVCPSPETVLP